MKQLGGHRDHALAVSLRGGDHQQRDDLTAGALVLADAGVGEFDEFFDPNSAVAQHFHVRPVPECRFLFLVDLSNASGFVIATTDRRKQVVFGPAIEEFVRARVGAPAVSEFRAERGLAGGVVEGACLVVAVLDVVHQRRKQGLALPGAVGCAFGDSAATDAHPAQVGGRNGTGRCPACPSFGFQRPALDVHVEGANRQKDALPGIDAR
ncbi:hypothetical protein [Nocardia amikacinitolerans]|uniref:hypothetical protein n=1 Tax=Nocardia amikacinitolerans TaxID=756689 RepID=UPI003555E694